jgi:hypothetical protein
VALVFLMSMFMAALDTTIVYVALPTITRDLDGTQASSGRVVITFVVGLAVSMPVAGWLSDRWGSKPTILQPFRFSRVRRSHADWRRTLTSWRSSARFRDWPEVCSCLLVWA